MAATYEPSLVEDKDKVRFLIQDTDVNKARLQDEEIQWLLSSEANVYMAAAAACTTLIQRSGGIKAKKIGDLYISYDPKFYVTLRTQLMSRGSSHQLPYAGGISIGDKTAQQDDTTSTQPSIFRNIDDNHQAPKPNVPPNNPLVNY